MVTSIEMLEQRIETLRAQVRQALTAGDRPLAASLRRELRDAEGRWEEALDHLTRDRAGEQDGPGHPAGGHPSGGLSLPLREQVYQALTLLTVPAAPKLISAVHEAFFAGAVFGARLTSLRRDEERSFRTAPFARPYYLCAALTADLLAPARGLLAGSTWPMQRRVIGPLSPRVDFLTAAIRVAESIQRVSSPAPEAMRLLWRFAVNIPGGATGTGKVNAPAVAQAAAAEREVHADADLATRRDAALRARSQLDDAQQLFGTRLRVTRATGTAR